MLITIGYGNYIEKEKVVSILKPGSAPLRKLKEQKKDNNNLIDASAGKPTRAFILMENGVLVLSAISTSTLAERLNNIPNKEIK